MKLHLFKRKGIFFLPSSFAGWILFLLAGIFAVYTFIDIDSHSHSVSDTLINFVFNLFLIGLGYSIVAYLMSERET